MTVTNFTLTADDVLRSIDLSGRQVVITGPTSGLGLTAASAFARAGADLMLVGRDPDRLEATAKPLRDQAADSVDVAIADLADLDSVRAAADRINWALTRLDILVLNAGIMAAPLERTPQGHELQLAVSHLGHFVLTARLAELLERSAPSRVISLSSSGHHLSGVDVDDPNFERRTYDKWMAYGQAKTAVIHFTQELARRLGPAGVTALSVHPGVIRTGLQRYLSDTEESGVMARFEGTGELRSPESGAASIVWAATADIPGNGAYIANAAVANDLLAPHAVDAEAAKATWTMTERLTGERFPG